MPAFQDITGQRFGRLVAVSVHTKASRQKRGVHTRWLCQCDCGKKHIVNLQCLKSGDTQSCGCLWWEAITTHGHASHYNTTGTYNSWKSMKRRCSDTNFHQYKDYGGRGITVCERWSLFDNFLADMGPRPKGHSIERINNDEGYTPDNCKWILNREQHQNKRPAQRNPMTAAHKASISAALRLHYTIQRQLAASADPQTPRATRVRKRRSPKAEA